MATAQLGAQPVDFTATLRSRAYVWNWFEAGASQNQYAYSGNLLRLNFAEKSGAMDFDEEIAVPFLLGLPANATAPAPQGGLGLGSNYYAGNSNQRYAAFAFPKQLWARYRFNGSHSLQAGRFEFNDGSELPPKNATLASLKRDRAGARLIGTFAFTDIGRSFDGLHYSWNRPGSEDFTFIAATPTRGVFQTDGWGWNRVAFAYAAFTKDWGHGRHAADTRFFALDYDDFRGVLKTDNRPLAARKLDLANIHVQTWGGHTIHTLAAAAGTVDALAWAVVQTGRWGTQTQFSYALDIEGGFQPAALPSLKPWIRAGYTLGSGDGNPNDNKHETFFQVLPTPRLYARTPFFNMMNLEDAFGALALRPNPKVTISNEFHSLRLTNANDLWYAGGGAYQPWTFGYTGRSTSGARSLANLYDAGIEYRASRHMTFTAYLGYMQGLAAIEKIYPGGKNGQFGYLEALFRM